ncbi:MAG: YdcF family protein [Pseudomonadota bacterium]
MILFAPAAAWAAGLAAFAAAIGKPAAPLAAPVDAVVVFTGGEERVTSGLALLNEGVGDRLLISGVHPETRREHIAAMWPGNIDRFECCVDLGLEARTTQGNAAELQDWTNTYGFQSVLLVTSDYHMPRAMLEAKRRAPKLTIAPYPVAVEAGNTNRPLKRFRRLAAEYTKYLLVRADTMFS